MSVRKGLFITLEGGEGAGKTTQINALSDYLHKQGYDVVITREPGGTPEAEKIRDLLVQREGGNWTPEAEVLLLFAARAMHLETLIRPALQQGKIVICDRFTDSTRAYQCYGHGLPLTVVEELDRIILDHFAPDITLILDLEPAEGLARSGRRLAEVGSLEDRFENLDISFHEKLRQGFLEIARQNPGRCIIIDASQPADKVGEDIIRQVMAKLTTANMVATS